MNAAVAKPRFTRWPKHRIRDHPREGFLHNVNNLHNDEQSPFRVNLLSANDLHAIARRNQNFSNYACIVAWAPYTVFRPFVGLLHNLNNLHNARRPIFDRKSLLPNDL
jgi:hypothetical protein